MNQEQPIKYPELINLIVETIEAMKGSDITILDVSKLCNFTDWMVISTGRSSRHVVAISEEIALQYKKHSSHIPSSEGEEGAEWVLVDCGDVIIHVMQDETRERYALEKLWA